MGVVQEWLEEHTASLLDGSVEYSKLDGIGSTMYVVARGRLPTEGRPNRRRREVRFDVEADVVAHVEKADAKELARTGKQLRTLVEKQLHEGGYKADSDLAEAFVVCVDDHALDA